MMNRKISKKNYFKIFKNKMCLNEWFNAAKIRTVAIFYQYKISEMMYFN